MRRKGETVTCWQQGHWKEFEGKTTGLSMHGILFRPGSTSFVMVVGGVGFLVKKHDAPLPQVVMQTGSVSMKKGMVISQEIKNRTTICSCNSTPRGPSQEHKNKVKKIHTGAEDMA